MRGDAILTWSPDSSTLFIGSLEDDAGRDFNEILTIRNGQLVSNITNVYTDNLVDSAVSSPDGSWFAFTDLTDSTVFKTNIEGELYTLPITDFEQVIAWFNIPSFTFELGGQYTITAAGSDLNLRETPSTDGVVKAKLQPGDSVTLVDGPVQADGYRWWKMQTGDGVEGWAVENDYWYTPDTLSQETGTPTP